MTLLGSLDLHCLGLGLRLRVFQSVNLVIEFADAAYFLTN